MSDKVDSKLAGGKDAAWWRKELGRSRTAWKDYQDRSKKIIERYRDERDSSQSRETGTKRFNILYSNTETLGPAIYSQVPIPDIRRRWQDKDAVGRLAAQVLQRATQYCVESYDFDSVLDACKLDYLLPGFCVARVKYKPYFKQTPKKPPEADAADATALPTTPQPPQGDEAEAQGETQTEAADPKAEMDEELIYQEVSTEYVGWDRFLMSRSRIYERVWWEAFGDDLTKDEVTTQFGATIAEQLTYGRVEEGTDKNDKNEAEPVARIWEVWCKRGRGRFCVAEGFDGWVKAPEADPLRLEQFFPNAKPVWSIPTNNTLVPIPEYTQYQDQAMELDDLTDRIDVLTSALRRRGVFDQQFAALAGMLTGKGDNQFVPIENWASFMEKGGLEKLAFEMPLDGLVAAIVQLESRRELVKQVIYEVTGIADIVRGSSNPNETLGAQELKGKWAGLRISSRQKKYANFARDQIRLKAEVIAERFDPQTLSLMSGVQLPYQADKMQYQQMQAMQQNQYQMAAQQAQQAGQPPPQQPQENPDEAKFYAQPTWEEIIGVLRDDKLRGFKIDIETDSTVQPDADAEKQARTELLTALGDFAQRMGPAVQSGLIPRPVAVEAIQFTMRAFKVGSQMEQELEGMEQDPGPTPQQQQKEQELQQREQAVMQAETKAKDAQHAADMAGKDAQLKSSDVAHKQEVYDLTQRFDEQVKRIEETFSKQMQALVQQAETHVAGIVKNMNPGAMQ
jgi:hypothetical protein